MGTSFSTSGETDEAPQEPTGDPLFLSECEVLYEGGPTPTQLFEGCRKNPGHPTFIPVREFSMDCHLPPGLRTQEVMRTIQNRADRTVKVITNYTSPQRPDTFPNSSNPYPFASFRGSRRKIRCGSGVVVGSRVVRSGEPCPCGACAASNRAVREYQEFIVNTAAHVVFDDEEAKHSTFELFYDSESEEDRKKVRRLHGIGLCDQGVDSVDDGREMAHAEAVLRKCRKDRVKVLCVSHDTAISLNPTPIVKWNEDFHNDEVEAEMDAYSCTTGPGETDGVSGGGNNYCTHTERDKSFGIIISHPHGRSKHITVGNILHFNNTDPLHVKDLQDRFHSKKSVLSSVAFRLFPKTNSKKADSSPVPKRQGKSPGTLVYSVNSGTQVRFASTQSTTTSWNGNPSNPQQSLLKHCRSLKPGSEYYSLAKDLVLSIPAGGPFLCKRSFDTVLWVTFPSGTRFRPIDESQTSLLPCDVRFDVPYWHSAFFKTYDIDTCPGCSGAPLLRSFQLHGSIDTNTHSGAMADGTNRCALEYT